MGSNTLILLDTHIWLWWINGGHHLSEKHSLILRENLNQGLAISMISCWEVAKLVESQRLKLAIDIKSWLTQATKPPLTIVPLTLDIVLSSTQLPAPFHRDPADQIIVATARELDIPLMTADQKIMNYPHVRTV